MFIIACCSHNGMFRSTRREFFLYHWSTRSFSFTPKALSSNKIDSSLKAHNEHTERFKAQSNILPSFYDSSCAHGSKSIFDIIRSIGVFQACRIKFFVKNAEGLLNVSYVTLGKTITNALMKHTFFKHFCAGENNFDLKPVIATLKANNIGPIFDYAAESESDGKKYSNSIKALSTQQPFNQPARIYDYKSEHDCDRNVEVFKKCIQNVHDVSPNGFAALKVTALGNPHLLERISTIIEEVKKLFASIDEKRTGFISREEFFSFYKHYFLLENTDSMDKMLNVLDPDNKGIIDYISFAKILIPHALPLFALKYKEIGPLAVATLSNEEVALITKISGRLSYLAEEAYRCKIKLLIDAEHTKYQPAIDSLVLELQQKYNSKETTSSPMIFNTYQCYLKDMPIRLITDLKRSERFSFHFAAKLVRGAYMIHERARAEDLGYPSPIHDTIVDTHQCFDEAIELLLHYRMQKGPGLEIMIASHNKESILKTVQLMSNLGLNSGDSAVHFAQLYGMSDNLTFTLGKCGYNAFKYLPYGKVQEVLPYLLRRVQENGDVLGSAGEEVDLLKQELKKRLFFT